MGVLGVAIADIIGKGIPAALCMSMIKYAMDRLGDDPLSPAEVLRDLNTVVERNVDPSMFITMVYGVYDSLNHQFRYATAGHEPGLFYSAKEDQFVDLKTKGLVLGVSREVEYPEYTLALSTNDAVILFSDGVTECKVDGKFMKRDTLKQLIRGFIHLPAQQAVEAIHQKLYEMTHYKIRDDQTILILKRIG
jgi:sigma-B regulation protein RsbU (phosphoserine phosphatase)